jgi:hypothetical protein
MLWPRAGLCYSRPLMHARLALLGGSLFGLLASVHCGGGGKKAAAPEPAVEVRAVDAEAQGGAGGSAAEVAEEEPRRPDPRLVQKALERTAGDNPSAASAHGLHFEVVEMGPQQQWGLAVVNRGTETLKVIFDPRLLTLEVEPPPDPKPKRWAAKPKTRICRLPDELRPARAEASYAVILPPGKGMVEAFDPRLYCLPDGNTSALVAGARVSPKFGFPPKTKVVWRGGKRSEQLVEQSEPFVAKVVALMQASDAGADAGSGEVQFEAEDDALTQGEAPVKQLLGTPFELGGDYAAPPAVQEPALALQLVRGSDARDESGVTVTTSLVNREKAPIRVYFRRELVSFEVTGPDGTLICDPQPDNRVPDRQAFSLLNPGAALTVTSRLVELCPDDTFARPGLYVVSAQFDGVTDGKEWGFDGFVGHVVAERPAVIRVRSGSLPFPGPRVLEPVKVGAP